MMPEYPPLLAEALLTRLVFRLEFEEDFELGLPALLQLRRELRQSAEDLRSSADGNTARQLRRLLNPEAFSDPVAIRRYRQPAPAFVLHPPETLPASLMAGDEVGLPVTFWGSGRELASAFGVLLEALGPKGLFCGHGKFILRGVEALDVLGATTTIWQPGRPAKEWELPYTDVAWWLENLPLGESLQVDFITPARLLSGNRPLFRPKADQVFGSMLRRISGMLYAWCALEVVEDAASFFSRFNSLEILSWDLQWQDWRTLQAGAASQDLGGLVGRVVLGGPELASIGWVVRLAGLMNVGKGAAYGAGSLRVAPG